MPEAGLFDRPVSRSRFHVSRFRNVGGASARRFRFAHKTIFINGFYKGALSAPLNPPLRHRSEGETV